MVRRGCEGGRDGDGRGPQGIGRMSWAWVRVQRANIYRFEQVRGPKAVQAGDYHQLSTASSPSLFHVPA
jgi:hypothetical protein